LFLSSLNIHFLTIKFVILCFSSDMLIQSIRL
jgi:hypothetical protein